MCLPILCVCSHCSLTTCSLRGIAHQHYDDAGIITILAAYDTHQAAARLAVYMLQDGACSLLSYLKGSSPDGAQGAHRQVALHGSLPCGTWALLEAGCACTGGLQPAAVTAVGLPDRQARGRILFVVELQHT